MRRLRAHVIGMQAAPLSTKPDNDRLLSMWLTSVSDMIEKYLDRSIGITTHTEYFSLSPEKRAYTIKGGPATAITSVEYDPSSLWEGDETEIDDCFIDETGNSIVLPYALGIRARKALKVVYDGGLAESALRSRITLGVEIATPPASSWRAGDYAIASNGAVGVVTDVTIAGTTDNWIPTLTVEDYYGVWELGSTVTRYTSETAIGEPLEYGQLNAIPEKSLAQTSPAIVQACEAQVRYMWKHTTDFENMGTVKDGNTTRRVARDDGAWPLQPEVIALLQPYVRYTF